MADTSNFDDSASESVESVEDQSLTGEKTDEEILADAHAFIAFVEEAESEERTKALDDIRFSLGDQWPAGIKNERDADGRPCLVINRIKQSIQQITNDQRQNRPSIKAHPVDDLADVETAKIRSGLIRHVEYNSSADVAYDTAFESAVRSGRGYWRVRTEYCDPMSFDQEILIDAIPNRFSVFFDPHSKKPDGSDASRAALTEDISPEDYRARFPKSQLAKSGEWEVLGNSKPDWVKPDSARIAEYFYKEFREAEIALLSNGQVVEPAKLTDEQRIELAAQGVKIVNERTAQVPVIKHCKLNACEVLEKTEWPGRWIPIIPVYGSVVDIDGKREIAGIVRDAKDPQRMYNYWRSAETETIALAPRAPWIVQEGQIEGYEEEWATANKRNHAYLTAKGYDEKGRPFAAPQRQAFEPAVQAISMAAMGAADDLKSTTSIYDATMGNRSNETSGKAIMARNNQAQTANFHFNDNLTRSQRHTGRILIDLFPKIYDTARTARIIGEEGDHKPVKLNQETGEIGKDGRPIVYRMDEGKYDVSVDVGPSFTTKRQEAAVSMQELTRAYPQIMQIAGDLLVKNMDWPGAQEIAERLKKTLPPNLAEDDQKQGQELPPEVQARMAQMNQMVEQLTAQLNQAQEALRTKRIEIESRERIEMAKLETQATMKLAELESKESLTLLAEQIAEIDRRQKMLGSLLPIQMNQEMEPEAYGAPVADVGPEFLDPTGGESPGSPMEGMNHDDPNAY